MNIEITDQEYRDLLDILHLADVIMTGHRRGRNAATERHRALIQKLYALARGGSLDRLIAYNRNESKYVPTADFERATVAHAVINEFGDHLFWDELISQLSARDAAQTVGGIDRLNAMSDVDRRAAESPIRQRYIEEFEAHGVANLTVIERFDGSGSLPAKTSD